MTTESSLQFRSATHADTDALVALVESAYRGDVSKRRLDHRSRHARRPPHRRRRYRGLPQRANSKILLAERPLPDGGRELLACAHVAIEDGAGYFGMFSVRPSLQGGGIGKALLDRGRARRARGMAAAGDAHDGDRHPRRTDRLLRAPRLPRAPASRSHSRTAMSASAFPSATTCASRCWKRRFDDRPPLRGR